MGSGRSGLESQQVLRKLHAGWLLTGALVSTWLRGFARHHGLRGFQANYAQEGLVPVSAEERRFMPAFGGCIACARCDRGEAERIAASRGAYPGVMELVLSAGRSMPDFEHAARAFSFVPEAVLEEKERDCPGLVPLVRLARFVRARAVPG